MTTHVDSIARLLAHSAVFFSREDWLPVADAQNNGGSGDLDREEQEETNQQVAGESSGAQSPTVIAGASSAVGGTRVQGNLGQASGAGTNTSITTITDSDPAVTLGAIQETGDISGEALGDYTNLAESALGDNESVATASIAAGVSDTALNDSFALQALQSSANEEANDTTAVEAAATESDQVANNGLAAAENETLAGVTPAQEFQSVNPETGVSSSSVSTIGTWLGIIVAVLTLFYFLRKGKLT